MNKTEQFIKDGWRECVRENREDSGTLIGLPYPYTVPAKGHFEEIYYWDTYFTNCGLLLDGFAELAKNNTDNLLYMADKYGFVPNGNRTYYLTRSQPPFLSEMVRDIYTDMPDKEWLKNAYKTLEKEYSFWMTKRISPIGLNVYGTHAPRENIISAAGEMTKRTGITAADDGKYNLGRHIQGVCESGWDITARWGLEIFNYAPVDLNSLMYRFEKNMEYFSREFCNQKAEEWNKKSETRLELMNRYLVKDGLFWDYNFAAKTHSSVFSAASLYPLYVKAASDNQAAAAKENLGRLEEEYGISATEKSDADGVYQWGYPNGWPCLQYIAVKAFDNYGYTADALRIAKKYVGLADDVFEKTGKLWEKYNVVKGNIEVTNEYEMPAMMGWSAGAYLAARDYINSKAFFLSP